MAKLEVQVRSCICCGLSIGSVLIGLYTLLLYALLLGLALWGLSDTMANGDSSHFNSCELEAQGKIQADNRKLSFQAGHTTVVVEDTTSYHCSLGLYTEELKFSQATRFVVLIIDVCLYAGIVLASLLLLIGIACYSQWLLLPWLFLMALDVIRGTISTLFIFVLTYGNLARIATAIFFLGLQTFHLAIWLIILAKFQRIYNSKHGLVLEGSQYYDARYPPSKPDTPSGFKGIPRATYSPQSAGRIPIHHQQQQQQQDIGVSPQYSNGSRIDRERY